MDICVNYPLEDHCMDMRVTVYKLGYQDYSLYNFLEKLICPSTDWLYIIWMSFNGPK